jgi:hypothetical protein
MPTVSHLDMFYNTRFSVGIDPTDPSMNPNAKMNRVPKPAEIRYEDGPNRVIDPESFEAPNEKGYETAMFLIGRAMADPDATVVGAE